MVWALFVLKREAGVVADLCVCVSGVAAGPDAGGAVNSAAALPDPKAPAVAARLRSA